MIFIPAVIRRARAFVGIFKTRRYHCKTKSAVAHISKSPSPTIKETKREGNSMSLTALNIGVARQIGTYSDAVAASGDLRWLFSSGTPGLSLEGTLPPNITAQAELAWCHIEQMLADADMEVSDIVKVTQYLIRAEDIPAYAAVRARHLGEARPASMLLILHGLVRPDFLIEVEVIAARAAHALAAG
jgi:2-iminobutanoate/2-iminopropanoate deaminase